MDRNINHSEIMAFRNKYSKLPLNDDNILSAIKEFKFHEIINVDLKLNLLFSFKRLNIPNSRTAMLYLQMRLFLKFLKFIHMNKGIKPIVNFKILHIYIMAKIYENKYNSHSSHYHDYKKALYKIFLDLGKTGLVDHEYMKANNIDYNTHLVLLDEVQTLFTPFENEKTGNSYNLFVKFRGKSIPKYLTHLNAVSTFTQVLLGRPDSVNDEFSRMDFKGTNASSISRLLNTSEPSIHNALKGITLLYKFIKVNEDTALRIQNSTEVHSFMGSTVHKVISSPNMITMITNSTFKANMYLNKYAVSKFDDLTDEELLNINDSEKPNYITNDFNDNDWTKLSKYTEIESVKKDQFTDIRNFKNSEINYHALEKHVRPMPNMYSKVNMPKELVDKFNKKKYKHEYRAPMFNAYNVNVVKDEIQKYISDRMDISISYLSNTKSNTITKNSKLKVESNSTNFIDKVNTYYNYTSLFNNSFRRHKILEIGQLEREYFDEVNNKYGLQKSRHKSGSVINYLVCPGYTIPNSPFEYGIKTITHSDENKRIKLSAKTVQRKLKKDNKILRWNVIDKNTHIPVYSKMRVKALEEERALYLINKRNSNVPLHDVYTILSKSKSDAVKSVYAILNNNFTAQDYKNISAVNDRISDSERVKNTFRYINYELNRYFLSNDVIKLSEVLYPKESVAFLGVKGTSVLRKMKTALNGIGLGYIHDISFEYHNKNYPNYKIKSDNFFQIDDKHHNKYYTCRYTSGTLNKLNSARYKDFDFTKLNTLYITDKSKFNEIRPLIEDIIIDVDETRGLVFLKLGNDIVTTGDVLNNTESNRTKYSEMHKHSFNKNDYCIQDFVILANNIRNIMLLTPCNENLPAKNVIDYLRRLNGSSPLNVEDYRIDTELDRIINIPDNSSIKLQLILKYLNDNKDNTDDNCMSNIFINRIIAETQHSKYENKIENLQYINESDMESKFNSKLILTNEHKKALAKIDLLSSYLSLYDSNAAYDIENKNNNLFNSFESAMFELADSDPNVVSELKLCNYFKDCHSAFLNGFRNSYLNSILCRKNYNSKILEVIMNHTDSIFDTLNSIEFESNINSDYKKYLDTYLSDKDLQIAVNVNSPVYTSISLEDSIQYYEILRKKILNRMEYDIEEGKTRMSPEAINKYILDNHSRTRLTRQDPYLKTHTLSQKVKKIKSENC